MNVGFCLCDPAGQALVGSEAQRMSLLQARVAAEQQRYWQDVQQRAAGGAAAQRYQHATARQLAQLEDDAAQRRQRVTQTQPRFFHLRAVLPVATAPAAPAAETLAAEQDPLQLQHVATLRRAGQVPLCEVPPSGTKLHGDRRYLPCCVPAGAASAAGTAARPQVYRKEVVPPLADDPLLLEVARQALGQQERQQPQQEQEQLQQDDAMAAGSEQEQQDQQQDQQAQQQAQPLFCLATSAFVAIVGTPMLQRRPAWEIPITVQHLPADKEPPGGDAAGAAAGAGGASSSGPAIVCIDKPLQQRVLTMRTKQQRLQKYAVLSLVACGQQRAGQAQQRDAEQQAGQEGQQGQAPVRRSTRSAQRPAATAPAEGAAAAGSSTPGGSVAPEASAARGSAVALLPPREASYDCWQLGGSRLLLRCHGRMQLSAPIAEGDGAQPAQAGGEDAVQAGGGQQGERAQQAAQHAHQAQHVLLALKTEYLPEEESGERGWGGV